MSLLFYGDPHGRHKNLFNVVEIYSLGAVVILGSLSLRVKIAEKLA
jgi:hypothetical protein